MNSRFLELLETKKGQNKRIEAEKIAYCLENYKDRYARENNKDPFKVPLKYVTHTDKEIVFLVDNNMVIVSQPNNKDIYTNMTNLLKLNKIDNSVITPNDYLKFNDYELLELNYNRDGFILTDELTLKNIRNDSEMDLNTSLKTYLGLTTITKLVSLYNQEKSLGLTNFKLNDLVLDENFYRDCNYLERLHLYNARELSELTLDEYIEQIKEYYSSIFDHSDIIEGIYLGKRLLKVKN